MSKFVRFTNAYNSDLIYFAVDHIIAFWRHEMGSEKAKTYIQVGDNEDSVFGVLETLGQVLVKLGIKE